MSQRGSTQTHLQKKWGNSVSNNIYGHVGYGIRLTNDADEFPEEFARSDDFLESLYPEGVPNQVRIESHQLKGYYSDHRYSIPLLLVGYDHCVTSSGDEPCDLSSFLESLGKNKSHWDELVADFVERCRKAGITFLKNDPRPFLFLGWDEIVH